MSPLKEKTRGYNLEKVMTMKEANRLSVMQQVDKKQLSLKEASEELELSIRQTKRLRKRYKAEGDEGLISKRRGLISPNKIPAQVRTRAIELLKQPLYEGFGPTYAMEKLEALHEITVSRETVRTWMVKEGLWVPKQKRAQRVYQRRTRRSRFGELLQGDGSPHDWFEGRGEKCSLLHFIDDATSQMTAGKFFPAETTSGYLEVLDEHLNHYGRPLGFYSDKHSIFRLNRESKGSGETHFNKVLKELDIEHICAHSPQAKGRVERANGTLQDRLVKEMRLKGINTIEEANAFLPEFMEDYNRRFGKSPHHPEDAHRPLRDKDDLKVIFARKAIRKLSKDNIFQYEGTTYQVETKNPNRIRKTHVEIIDKKGEPIEIKIGGISYGYKKWEDIACKRPKILDAKELEGHWRRPLKRKPGKHHPWR